MKKRLNILAIVMGYIAASWASGPGNSTLLNINHNQRSDTIDVLHYDLDIKILSVTAAPIIGKADITITPKMNNISSVAFDLLQMTIDSVCMNGNTLLYNYNDTLLRAYLGTTLQLNDTITLQVFYHGIPQGDPSGFGGFDFAAGYAYNLGVGFNADPHVYGRAWHPCFDNFVERATYSFHITTQPTHKAVCNGLSNGSNFNPDSTVVWHWAMNQTIPSYLACVSVAAYTTVNQNYQAINGNIPVELVALPTDTTNLKNAFVHLPNAFQIFEQHFGPYRWDKVGYVIVPFNGGAMEHATNIAYPKFAITGGSLTYESIMSHELSHHWFGDLVTCETAEDMWLNEGWAEFSSFVCMEGLYGKTAYQNTIRANHAKVLQFAHVKEGGYRAVSGVPHQWTYGDHVYLKGADMAHNIRAYLGDSLFFNGIKYYLNQHAFDKVNSYQMRDDLSNFSGISLQACFDNWVFNPGYAHFAIDSFTAVPNAGNYQVTVIIRQKLTGAPNYFSQVPLQITCKGQQFETYTAQVLMSGQQASFTISAPFMPACVLLNHDGQLSDATVSQYKNINTIGTTNFADAKMSINTTAIVDSVLLCVTHHFAAADDAEPWRGYMVSPYRYYSIDGIMKPGYASQATIPYDGRATSATGNQHLDNLLFVNGLKEDSLVLLYRRHAGRSWSEFPYYTKNMGNVNDKYGSMVLDSVMFGEFVLAMKTGTTGIAQQQNSPSIKVFPNPASGNITIDISELPGKTMNAQANIFNAQGQKIYTFNIDNNASKHAINTSHMPQGQYFIQLLQQGKQYFTSFIISHQ